MPEDLLRYDLLVQEALRGVVRKVLADVVRDGGRLPGDHHFYISFRTHAPGVRVSQRLRDEYPDEMTIVMQYQFWDLGVTDHTFEIGLSFKNVPERLLIPFTAVTGFFDPSVQFGLKFEASDAVSAKSAGSEKGASPPPALPAPAGPTSVPRLARKPRGVGSEPVVSEPSVPASAPEGKPSADADKPGGAPSPNAAPAADGADAGDGEAGDAAPKVISLDTFRKKKP